MKEGQHLADLTAIKMRWKPLIKFGKKAILLSLKSVTMINFWRAIEIFLCPHTGTLHILLPLWLTLVNWCIVTTKYKKHIKQDLGTKEVNGTMTGISYFIIEKKMWSHSLILTRLHICCKLNNHVCFSLMRISKFITSTFRKAFS